MAKTESTTPARTPASKKQAGTAASSATKNQSSILGFFSKTPTTGLPVLKKTGTPTEKPAASATKTNGTAKALKRVAAGTPVASSDAVEPPSELGDGIPESSPSRRVRPLLFNTGDKLTVGVGEEATELRRGRRR